GIEGLMTFFDSKAFPRLKGKLSGQSELTSESGSVKSNGKFKLDEAKINDLNIGYAIGLDYKLSAGMTNGLVNIESSTLQLGSTPLSAAGSINTAATPPIIDLKIKSGDVSIAEIARLVSAFGIAF